MGAPTVGGLWWQIGDAIENGDGGRPDFAPNKGSRARYLCARARAPVQYLSQKSYFGGASGLDPAPEAEPTLVDGRGAFSTVRARSDSTPRPLRKEDGDV